MHRHTVAHRTGHQLLSVSIAFQCLHRMVDCISNHKIVHSVCAVMLDCCCQRCIISYFCVAPIFNDVVPRSVLQFPNSSPEMHLSSFISQHRSCVITAFSQKRHRKHVTASSLTVEWTEKVLLKGLHCNENLFSFFFSAQALQRKWPIMLAAILGLFLTFLCLTLSSVRVQSHPLELGWWLCLCVSVCIWQSRRGMGASFGVSDCISGCLSLTFPLIFLIDSLWRH